MLSGFLSCLVKEGEAYQFELCCCHLHFVNDESNFNKELKNNPFLCQLEYHQPLDRKDTCPSCRFFQTENRGL